MYSMVLIKDILMFVILALSWNMFSSPSGYVSLATAAFYGVGVYTTALFGKTMADIFGATLSLPILMLLGGLLSFILAVGIGAVTLRLRGVYFTIFTFGLVELLRSLAQWLHMRLTGNPSIQLKAEQPVTILVCVAVLFVLLVAGIMVIRRSRLGKSLEAIGESEDAAAHIGINTTFVKVLVFAISAFAAGAVGAINAKSSYSIRSDFAFKTMYSFLPVLMAIFGGTRNTVGPVVGAIIFAYLQEILLTKIPQLYMIIFGAVMVVAILFLPNGIVGLVKPYLERIFRRKERAMQ